MRCDLIAGTSAMLDDSACHHPVSACDQNSQNPWVSLPSLLDKNECSENLNKDRKLLCGNPGE
jgi:hypothetical protein